MGGTNGKETKSIKSKKIRKQLLTASAAGLVIVSSVAGTGTLAYATENQAKTPTEQTAKAAVNSLFTLDSSL